MTTQPEALELAGWLDTSSYGPLDNRHKAAAMLRAQHAEIEADNRNLGILTDALAQCSKTHADLEAENKRLREALKAICDEQDANEGYATPATYDAARAALEPRA